MERKEKTSSVIISIGFEAWFSMFII